MKKEKPKSKIEEINRSWLQKKFETAKRSKRSKQNKYKGIMRIYLDSMNKCLMPDCNFGYDLEVHHIQPLSKGGTDTFDNLIILCRACHRGRKFHSNWKENRITLLTLKFYNELGVLGFTSDCSDEEFLKKIAEFKASNKISQDISKKSDV